MKRVFFIMILCLLPQFAYGYECVCGGNFGMWVGQGWAKFVQQFTTDTAQIQAALISAGATAGEGGLINAETEKATSQVKAEADAITKHNAAHTDRMARAEMHQVDVLTHQDTVAQKANPECPGETIAASDGKSFASGMNNAKVLESVIASEMNRDARKDIKQGTNLLDYRKQLETKYPRKDYPRDYLPADGSLTYSQKQLEAVSHFTALAMNPEGRLPADKIGLKGKDADHYNALLAQRQYLTSFARAAMSDYIVDRAAVVPEKGVRAMVLSGDNVNAANLGATYKSVDGKVSRLAQRQAWVEHYLSPAIGRQMNAYSAPSQIYEVAARIYALQVEEVTALKRAAALMGLSDGTALATLDKRLDAASLPR